MYLDQRYAVEYPEPDHTLEFAARLIAACPSALVNIKTTKELFDKTVELADMFYAYLHRNDPKKREFNLSALTDLPGQTEKPDQPAPT